MNYQELQPSGHLSQFIDQITFNGFKLAAAGSMEHVIPDGMTELVFNFGSGYERKIGSKNDFAKICGSHVVGIKSQPHEIRHNDSMNTIAVRFRPAGLSFFTSIPLNEFIDSTVPAEVIFGTDIKILEEQLYHCPALEKQVLLLEQFLLNRLQTVNKHRTTCDILTCMYQNPALFKLSECLENKGFYYKKLERQFQELIGLAPKQLARIVRMNYAVISKIQNSSLSFTELTYLAGYCDQSHLIREFQHFAGKKPKDYFLNFLPLEKANLRSVRRLFAD